VKKVLMLQGSDSDTPISEFCALKLLELGVPYEARVTSAHRTPKRLSGAACTAAAEGFSVIIGFAGGSAHLQGMAAAETIVPVIGVAVPSADNPINSWAAMLSETQMPGGVPLLYAGMGKAGAVNAALSAVAILALSNDNLFGRLKLWREKQTADVPLVPTFTKAPVEYKGE